LVLGSDISVDDIERHIRHVPVKLKPVLALWAQGRDLRDFYAATTLQRYRTELQLLLGMKLGARRVAFPPGIQWNDLLTEAAIIQRIPDWAKGHGVMGGC
jgi:hypothetical protein